MVTEVSCFVRGLLRPERGAASIHCHDCLVHGDQHLVQMLYYIYLFCGAKSLVTIDPVGKGNFHILLELGL